MSSKLDQIVKGAPSPSANPQVVPPSGITSSNTPLADPLASLPSSPPQIYLNLLILEASLRAQYLELRARRRQHTFFLTLLLLWTSYFTYALFLAPREDGSGVGGSVYWVVEVAEKVCLMGGVVTAILVWGTGTWERGVRWPRRWVGTTNRGLRGFNCKIVVVKGPMWKEWLDMFKFFLSQGLFLNNGSSTYRYVDQAFLSEADPSLKTKSSLPNIHEDEKAQEKRHGHEEDLSPGGDTIALLLLPKPFSPSFRENWETYRNDYWDKENERRRILLQKLKIRDARLAKSQAWWRRWFWRYPKADIENPKSLHPHHAHTHSHTHSSITQQEKRLRSGSLRSSSHSRNSSRSSTPAPGDSVEPEPGHVRRSSTASNSGTDRRRKRTSISGSALAAGLTTISGGSSASRVQKLTPTSAGGTGAGTGSATNSRAGTPTGNLPDISSPLVRGNSFTSVSSADSEVDRDREKEGAMNRERERDRERERERERDSEQERKREKELMNAAA